MKRAARMPSTHTHRLKFDKILQWKYNKIFNWKSVAAA